MIHKRNWCKTTYPQFYSTLDYVTLKYIIWGRSRCVRPISLHTCATYSENSHVRKDPLRYLYLAFRLMTLHMYLSYKKMDISFFICLGFNKVLNPSSTSVSSSSNSLSSLGIFPCCSSPAVAKSPFWRALSKSRLAWSSCSCTFFALSSSSRSLRHMSLSSSSLFFKQQQQQQQ